MQRKNVYVPKKKTENRQPGRAARTRMIRTPREICLDFAKILSRRNFFFASGCCRDASRIRIQAIATNIYDRGGKSLALVKNKLSQTSMLSEVKFESLTFLFISKTFAIVNCSVCRLKCLPVKVRKSKYMLIIVVLRVKIPLKKLTLREISRNFLIL